MRLAILLLAGACAFPVSLPRPEPVLTGPVEMHAVSMERKRPAIWHDQRLFRALHASANHKRWAFIIPIGRWAPEFRCNLLLLVEQNRPWATIPEEFWEAVGVKDGALEVDVRILDAVGVEVRRLSVRVPRVGNVVYPLPPLEGPHTVLVVMRPGLMMQALVSLIDNTSNDPTSLFGVLGPVEIDE